MDINGLYSVITVVSFIAFAAIVLWAWSGRRKPDFEAAARLPLEDDVDAGARGTDQSASR